MFRHNAEVAPEKISRDKYQSKAGTLNNSTASNSESQLRTTANGVQSSKKQPGHALHSTNYAALFLFLFAIYLLTYTPRINSSDGLAMFATAESLARRWALDIEQIRWMGLQQGTYGLDGLLYSRKGIGVPIGLLPLTWLGLIVPWFGTVSVSLLFNVIVTALTAVLLLAYLVELGYWPGTGVIVALTYGLATLAWPYAKSLFSDPFSGLLLLAAAYALLKMSKEMQKRRGNRAKPLWPKPTDFRSFVRWSWSLRYPFLAGLFLGWNVATRYAEAVFLPVYGLLLLYYLFRDAAPRPESDTVKPPNKPSPPPSSVKGHGPRFTLDALGFWSRDPRSRPDHFFTVAAFCTPIACTGLALIFFNISRYGDPLNTGYLPNETFSGILWQGLIGQLVSPGRGLLLYSPIFVMSILGVVPFLRRFRPEAALALSIITIHLLLYGKWFMWHGGYAWGPRFMIPTLPFWALFLAPIAAQAFSRSPQPPQALSSNFQAPILRFLFLGLAALSLIPQLLSVVIDFAPFQNALLDSGLPLFDPQTFFDLQYSPLVAAWTFVGLDRLDLAWFWQGEFNAWLLAILLVNIVVAGTYLKTKFNKWRIDRESPEQVRFSPNRTSRRLTTGFFLHLTPYLCTLLATLVLLSHTHSLPAESLQQAVLALNKAIQPADAIITNEPGIATPFAELYKGRAMVLGLNHGGFPLPTDVARRLVETTATHSQIWWLPNWLPPAESGIEQTLLSEGYPVRQDTFGDQRLLLFAYPINLAFQAYPKNVAFAAMIKLEKVAYPAQSSAGEALPIALSWQALQPVAENYHVFIHLLDKNGQLLAQADGQPAQWTRPTSSWGVGEDIIDRHGLWIPVETGPGIYELLVGLYRPSEGQRLILANGEDAVKFEVRIE